MHLVYGELLAGCIFSQGINRNDILGFKDDLLVGPVFSVKQNERCFKERIAFWEMFLSKEFKDVHTDYSALKRIGKRLLTDEKITIWYLNDTRGKLFFLWLINTLTEFDVDFQKVSFFRLNTEEYLSILRQPRSRLKSGREERLKAADFKEIYEIWNLLVSNNPDDLSKHLSIIPNAIIFDHSNLLDCLYRYPFPKSGLNQMQYRLLKIIKKNGIIKGSKLLPEYINKYESQSCSHTDKIIYFLKPLSQKMAKNTLITIENNIKSIFRSSISITEYGLKAIECDFNHVLNNGIDTWVLGKHLVYPGDSLWYFDGKNIIRE